MNTKLSLGKRYEHLHYRPKEPSLLLVHKRLLSYKDRGVARGGDMREIKFRAWEGDKMTYDMVVCYGKAWSLIDDRPIEGAILMQYVGLKDKNGKEGYGSDFWEYAGDIYLITWDCGGFYLHDITGETRDMGIMSLSQGKIIGNKFSNPELLEVKK